MDKVFENPDVYRVRVPFVNLGSGESNCYIVRDGAACMVVDPGAASEVGMARVRGALGELGVAAGKCDVFLTHTHFDHAEATKFLFSKGVRVYVSHAGFAEREPVRAEVARVRFAGRMALMGASPERAEAYSRCDFEPTVLPADAFDYHFVREGDAVTVGRYEFRVVETPGHTLDHLCLVGCDGAPSFTGDEVLFDTTPCVDSPFGDEDALNLYMLGLEGAWMRDVCCALPGHGESIDGDALRARAADIVAHKHAHCGRLHSVAAENPGIAGVPLARLALTRKSEAEWNDASDMSRYYTLLEALVDARHLEGRGELRREEENGAWRFYAM